MMYYYLSHLDRLEFICVLKLPESIYKHVAAYAVAHSDMLDAEHAREDIQNNSTIIRYTEALDKVEKIQKKILKLLPEGVEFDDVISNLINMLGEVYADEI